MNKKNTVVNEIFSWIKVIVLSFVFAIFITRVIIVNAEVPTSSMEKTIMTNDRLVAFRLSYMFSDVERGDIVVFPSPEKDELLVKRVVGMPNDTIEIIDGIIYIQGEPLEEEYVSSQIEDATKNSGPYIVPEGHLFMMGDNRKYSKDSRYWESKFIEEEKVIGKVIFRYYPNISFIE